MSSVSSLTPHPVQRSREHWSDLSRDWSRMADQSAPAQTPFKVYLPRTTSDVVRAVREAKALGHPLVVRGGGHSSNDLATAPGGALLLTEALDRVLNIDVEALTVTVQPGPSVMEVDQALAEYGLGLEVVPDHFGITVGGYVSVGGLSAASLHAGLIVDTVTALEYVDLLGNVHRRSRGDDPEAFRHRRFSIGVVDWSVGDPSRFLVTFAPIESLEAVFAGVYEASLELRAHTGELTSLAIQLKGIRSDFLAPGEPDRVYVEILLVAGVRPTPQAAGVLRELASAIDSVCLEHGAYRYMHTLVSRHEPAELRRLDPAGRYAVQEVSGAAA